MKTKVKSAKSLGIGATATEAVAKGASYQETLELIRELFPDARTTIRNIQWYASRRRTQGGKRRAVSRR